MKIGTVSSPEEGYAKVSKLSILEKSHEKILTNSFMFWPYVL